MENLISILAQTTALTKDVDLFAYEIPLKTGGLWLADSQTDSRFNGTGVQEFAIYYRGKVKQQAMDNIKYLKDAIDGLSGSTGTCRLADDTTFKLWMIQTWDYLEKDAEGYFVWANTLRLLSDEPQEVISA